MSIQLWQMVKDLTARIENLEKPSPAETVHADLLVQIEKLKDEIKLQGQRYTALNARLGKALKKE